jgi:hypothetical protein
MHWAPYLGYICLSELWLFTAWSHSLTYPSRSSSVRFTHCPYFLVRRGTFNPVSPSGGGIAIFSSSPPETTLASPFPVIEATKPDGIFLAGGRVGGGPDGKPVDDGILAWGRGSSTTGIGGGAGGRLSTEWEREEWLD